MIITIANEKGGSGKSTLCLNLCVQLLLDKKDIAALDTDSQKSLECSIILGVKQVCPISRSLIAQATSQTP